MLAGREAVRGSEAGAPTLLLRITLSPIMCVMLSKPARRQAGPAAAPWTTPAALPRSFRSWRPREDPVLEAALLTHATRWLPIGLPGREPVMIWKALIAL